MSRRAHRGGESQLLRGELVILAVTQLQGSVHGYQLREVFGSDSVKNGTVYRQLKFLADVGLLGTRIESEEEAGGHPGPARRLYEITEAGSERLRRETAFMDSILPVLGVEVEQISTLDL